MSSDASEHWKNIIVPEVLRSKRAHKMTFRFANSSDLPVVAQMNRELLQGERLASDLSECEVLDRLAKWMAEGHRIILFDLECQPVGYALFSFGERLGEQLVYLRHFFIRKEHRRKGYGRKAMEHLESEIWPRGVSVYVDTRAENRGALDFWKSLHFEVFSVTLARRP